MHPALYTARRSASYTGRILVLCILLCAIHAGPGWVSGAWAQGPCGNGNLNPGEQCDEGSGVNGSFESCCAVDCTFRVSGAACSLGTDDLCDAPNTCDGAGTCEVNIAPSTKTCRPAVDDCDAAELCDGVSISCGVDEVAPVGTPCRPSAGVCDVPESCDGSGVQCPTDVVAASSVECRAPAGACDVAESCDGSGVDCPADVVAASSVECRAPAGACDVAESCDGSSVDCPSDVVADSSVECRVPAGVCDVAEFCDGSSPGCPDDAKSTDVCRISTDAACDPAESCDGQGNHCPEDGYTTDGTICDDGNECTIEDACSIGACVGNPQTCGDNLLQSSCGEECDDGGTDPNDGCSEICTFEVCRSAPRSDCIALSSAKFIAKEPKPTKATLRVILGKSEAPVELEDFGDFVNGSDTLGLCIYDDADALLRSYVVDRGSDFCQGSSCWTVNSKTGYSFKDLTADDSGIFKMRLRPGGAAGQSPASVQISGKTVKAPAISTLPRIADDLAGNTRPTIQTTFDTGVCLSARLDVGVLKRPGVYIGRKR